MQEEERTGDGGQRGCRGDGGQRGCRGCGSQWYPTTPPLLGGLPGAGVGRQRPGSRVMARLGEQVGLRHRPQTPPGPAAAAAHRAGGAVLPTAPPAQ